MSTIPKLPKEPSIDQLNAGYGRWFEHCRAEHYKAVAEAQAELLHQYRSIFRMPQLLPLDDLYDQLQIDIEEARKP